MPVQDYVLPQRGPEVAHSVFGKYEEREAARFACLSWEAYQALPRAERAATVGHYRCQKRLEAILMHEASRKR